METLDDPALWFYKVSYAKNPFKAVRYDYCDSAGIGPTHLRLCFS